jgi:hypothetical protein
MALIRKLLKIIKSGNKILDISHFLLKKLSCFSILRPHKKHNFLLMIAAITKKILFAILMSVTVCYSHAQKFNSCCGVNR